jgi:hypothetical protein
VFPWHWQWQFQFSSSFLTKTLRGSFPSKLYCHERNIKMFLKAIPIATSFWSLKDAIYYFFSFIDVSAVRRIIKDAIRWRQLYFQQFAKCFSNGFVKCFFSTGLAIADITVDRKASQLEWTKMCWMLLINQFIYKGHKYCHFKNGQMTANTSLFWKHDISKLNGTT